VRIHTQRIKVDNAEYEAARIEREFAKLPRPNTTDGKYYLTEVSAYFAQRTDNDKWKNLSVALPYKTLELRIFGDKQGVYAMVKKDELERNRKVSLIKQIQEKREKASSHTPAAAAHKKKQELEV